MAKGNLPDFEIKALNLVNRDDIQVGVGWQKEEGRVSIKFNSFVDLNQLRADNRDVIVTMFPRKDK